MAQDYKLAIVAGGLAGCALVAQRQQRGLANDNVKCFVPNLVTLRAPVRAAQPGAWPEGLRHHTAVLMNVSRGETLVRVTYPLVG